MTEQSDVLCPYGCAYALAMTATDMIVLAWILNYTQKEVE